jgi:hypothetical protein
MLRNLRANLYHASLGVPAPKSWKTCRTCQSHWQSNCDYLVAHINIFCLAETFNAEEVNTAHQIPAEKL